MQLILIFGIVIAIGAVLFALQNNSPVMVTLAFWTFEGSLALVLLVSLGLGALIAGFLSSPSAIRKQWAVSRMRSRVADLERQVAALRQRNHELEAELARQPAASASDAVADKPYVGMRVLLSGSGAEGPDTGR